MKIPYIKPCAGITLLVMAVLFLGQAALAETPPSYRVFILHSYEADHVCGEPQHKGVVNVGGIYPAALLLKDAAGRTRTAPEIFAWTAAHSKKPEIALNYAFTRMGLFGITADAPCGASE